MPRVPPIQQSVALESYLKEVKLAEIQFTKPRNNLPPVEGVALKWLKSDETINIRKADKGTVTVLMNKENKINGAQIQLDNMEHYRPLTEPMVQETHNRVLQLINELHDYNHIDEMTKKWLCQTPNPPRIPIFYTLTKIHKPTPECFLLPQCSIPVRTLIIDRELQKKDLASVTLVFGVFGLPLHWAFLRLPVAFRKERELGPNYADWECAEIALC